MKKLFLVLFLSLSACQCGYEALGSEATGQVKKVVHRTPLVCPRFDSVDISLGVIRNGVGSMSNQDMWFTVENPADSVLLDQAARTGSLVNVRYDTPRGFIWCWDMHWITSVELTK